VINQWFDFFWKEFYEVFKKVQAKKAKEMQQNHSSHEVENPCGAVYCPLGNKTNNPKDQDCIEARESESEEQNVIKLKRIDELRQQFQEWLVYALLNESALVDDDMRSQLKSAAHAKLASQGDKENFGDDGALSFKYLYDQIMQNVEQAIEPMDTLLEISGVARGVKSFDRWVKTVIPMEALLLNFGLKFDEKDVKIEESKKQFTLAMGLEEAVFWSRLTKGERQWVEENTGDSWKLSEIDDLMKEREKRNKVSQYYNLNEISNLDAKYVRCPKPKSTKIPVDSCKKCNRKHTGKCPKPQCSNCGRKHTGECKLSKTSASETCKNCGRKAHEGSCKKCEKCKKVHPHSETCKKAKFEEWEPCTICKKKHKGGAAECRKNPDNRTKSAAKYNLEADRAVQDLRLHLKLLSEKEFSSLAGTDRVGPSLYDQLCDPPAETGKANDVYEVLSNVPVTLPGVGKALAAVDTMSNVNCVSETIIKSMETIPRETALSLMDDGYREFALNPPATLKTGNGQTDMGKMLFTTIIHNKRRVVMPVFVTSRSNMPSNTDILLSLYTSRKLFTPKKLAEMAVGNLVQDLFSSRATQSSGGKRQ